MQQLIVVIAFGLLGNGGSLGGKRIGTRLKLVSKLTALLSFYQNFPPVNLFFMLTGAFTLTLLSSLFKTNEMIAHFLFVQ